MDEEAETRPETRILLDLRPALEGYSGIPQETRVLFKRLHELPGIEVDGLIQSSLRVLPRGLDARAEAGKLRPSKQARRMARVVIALVDTPRRLIARWREKVRFGGAVLRTKLKVAIGKSLRLTRFEPAGFEDFIWRGLFAKSLAAADRAAIVGRRFRISATPWDAMFAAGTPWLLPGRPRYPIVDTRPYAIFIAQKPFAGRVAAGSRLVIRYHDAIPVFMPQVVIHRSRHVRHHMDALSDNVRSGAWFSCISESTRKDLISLFPEAEARAVTVHNIVSGSYFREDSEPARLPSIVRSSLYESSGWLPTFASARASRSFYEDALTPGRDDRRISYLLMVGTLEPRKNHERLVSAWETLRAAGLKDLKLIIVGTIGWDTKAIEHKFRRWIDAGELFLLQAVPPRDMRALYRHARATVCPSLSEGFDYPGVEAMRCGGAVVASDLPVHREVYDDAALYFDPYSTSSLVAALTQLVEETPGGPLRAGLERRGADVSARYTPEAILPQWEAFLKKVAAS